MYPAGSTGANPQAGIDAAIGNLSQCTSVYDDGGTGCSVSILDTALSYIITLASHMTGGPLKLSVSLMAGMYTPTSVLGTVGTLDFPQKEGMMTSCARQPLAWHTTGTSPYVATAYEREYTYAVLALGAEIHRVLAASGSTVQINVIKDSAITSNSIEFDVAARPTIMTTGTDPRSASPPQGGTAIQCPDHAGQDMVTALLNAYAATGSSRW